jgi:hypothetical protein
MLQGERPSTEVGAGDPDVTIRAVANVSASCAASFQEISAQFRVSSRSRPARRHRQRAEGPHVLPQGRGIVVKVVGILDIADADLSERLSGHDE